MKAIDECSTLEKGIEVSGKIHQFKYWDDLIAPFIRSCTSCHSSNDMIPFSICNTYL
jgi:hypothetical protein